MKALALALAVASVVAAVAVSFTDLRGGGGGAPELTAATVPATPSTGGEPVNRAAEVGAPGPGVLARVAVDDHQREIPKGERGRLLASAPAEQAAILGDGVVTRDELATANDEARSCATAATAGLTGVEFDSPQWDGTNFRWGFNAPTRELLAAAGAEYDACHARYVSVVSEAWSMAKAYERLIPLWRAMATCMNGEGVAVAADADWSEMMDAERAAGRVGLVSVCTVRAQSAAP